MKGRTRPLGVPSGRPSRAPTVPPSSRAHTARREVGSGREPPRLLDRLCQELRLRHYSGRAEAAYVGWARRFILFHQKRHPREMGAPEITAFLSHPAVVGGVSAATQNQALNALVFLYERLLEMPVGELGDVVRAKRLRHLPVVLTPEEVRRLLAELSGPPLLVASLRVGQRSGRSRSDRARSDNSQGDLGLERP